MGSIARNNLSPEGPADCLNSSGIGRKLPPRGFTLIELWLSISIIAFYRFAFAPPGPCQRIRPGAVCLSHLHQIGIALQLYVRINNRLLACATRTLTRTTDCRRRSGACLIIEAIFRVLLCPQTVRAVRTPAAAIPGIGLLMARNADHLSALVCSSIHTRSPWCSQDPFIKARGPAKECQLSYAKRHIKNLLAHREAPVKPSQ